VSLWDTFTSLPRPSAQGSYTVQHGTDRFRVGRSYENHPAILIEFSEPRASSLVRRLANLTYSPPSIVDLARSDGVHQRALLAVLECHTSDPDLAAYFFRIAQSILLDDRESNTEQGFERALDALVTLFRALQRSGVRTVQGLWAELAVILWAADSTSAMSSWHSSPHALHDFGAGSFRLEVKSSLKGLREHTFLLDQLATVGGGTTIVASILLNAAADGLSVFDLTTAIVPRLRRDSASRLEVIVADSLGNSWREAGETRFSLEAARTSLRLYRAEQIPTIPQPLPPEVKDVRFTVDLSSTPHLGLVECRACSELFAKLLPHPA
jgi:Putative  PD-(D/E)XK family member, (DUF4420)